MRFLLAVLSIGIFTAPAFAFDEFGERFANIAPSALGDDVTDTSDLNAMAESLQDIMPAAGDEEPAATTPAQQPADASAAQENTQPQIVR